MINEENLLHYPNSIETRVALLEMSMLNINQTLLRIENEIKDVKIEIKDLRKEIRTDIKDVKKDMKNDTRWLLTVIAAVTGIMAHGFHWF